MISTVGDKYSSWVFVDRPNPQIISLQMCYKAKYCLTCLMKQTAIKKKKLKNYIPACPNKPVKFWLSTNIDPTNENYSTAASSN